jgi:hypothetical protein
VRQKINAPYTIFIIRPLAKVEFTPLSPPLIRGETNSLPLIRGGLGWGALYFCKRSIDYVSPSFAIATAWLTLYLLASIPLPLSFRYSSSNLSAFQMENKYAFGHEEEAADFLQAAPIKEDWGGDGRGRMNLSGRRTAMSKGYVPRQYQYFDTNAVPEEYGWRVSGMPENVAPGSRRLLTWHDCGASTILWFGYKGIPNAYLYEMIQISPCNNYRSRTWHWFKSDRLYQRTLIQEERQR